MTSKTGIEMVQEFHRKFDLPDGEGDHKHDLDAAGFRWKFLREEADEFMESLFPEEVMTCTYGELGGYTDTDKVHAFDALLDLAYVAYGTALMMGITPQQWADGFAIVHEHNMMKERAKSKEDSKRGSALDVIKPPGWTPPEPALYMLLCGDKRDV